MWNARLDVSQAGIKIAKRNINLWYPYDTTVMKESKEELKIFLIKVKEESEKAGLKLNIQKTKTVASGPNHFMANGWGENRNSDGLFSWALISLQIVTAHMKLKDACSLEEKLWQT